MSGDTPGGVPAELVTANDFVQVRLALLRYLGGALEAILFTRIVWRTRAEDRSWIEHDGRRWWTVTLSDLALETGHSEGQVRRALDALVTRTAVRRHQLRENGPYDRRYSYTPVISDVSNTTDRAAENDASQVSNSTDVPLLIEGENPPTPHDKARPHEDSPWAGEECDVRRNPRGPHELDGDALACLHCHARNPNITAAERDTISARRKLTALRRDRALPIELDELMQHAARLGDGDLLAGYQIVERVTERTLDGTTDPAAALRARLRPTRARRVQAA
ncbi:hypothetical protein F6W70_15420 [Microbacterium maritypicum]|uniref:Helix-turn-helix domain-containing protein n=1 Tax=Microbacterium maritypicum TaxID=33918 RepID=A0AAD3X1X3_MICMQ|nr:hypothetical protein [Microbacterium liquefaciens]KAB1883961.1 hypothetical protein F6W70_15420 [Microbacterium liquefaciens]